MPKKPDSAGVGKVTALPSARKIPPCKFPLKTTEGKREYETNARILFDAGKLDSSAHVQLSLYAVSMDEISRRIEAGEPVRASHMTNAQKALRALKIHELEQPVAAPEDKATNRFAVFGFACRRRPGVQADLA